VAILLRLVAILHRLEATHKHHHKVVGEVALLADIPPLVLATYPTLDTMLACQEGTCNNPKAQGWPTLVSLGSQCLVMEEHQHLCQVTLRSLHQILPCQPTEEEEEPCQ